MGTIAYPDTGVDSRFKNLDIVVAIKEVTPESLRNSLGKCLVSSHS